MGRTVSCPPQPIPTAGRQVRVRPARTSRPARMRRVASAETTSPVIQGSTVMPLKELSGIGTVRASRHTVIVEPSTVLIAAVPEPTSVSSHGATRTWTSARAAMLGSTDRRRREQSMEVRAPMSAP